jgi:hypothetical protein
MVAGTHLTLASILSIIDEALPKYVPRSSYMFVLEAFLWTWCTEVYAVKHD